MDLENLTEAQKIEMHYSAMMDSYNLLEDMAGVEDEYNTIERNIEHLKIMVAKDFWTNEDLSVFDKYVK